MNKFRNINGRCSYHDIGCVVVEREIITQLVEELAAVPAEHPQVVRP